VHFLECKKYLVTKKNGQTYYNITSNSIDSVSILIQYLDKYPLKTSKYLDYQSFKQVAILIRNKDVQNNLEIIKYLKRGMNNSRTDFI